MDLSNISSLYQSEYNNPTAGKEFVSSASSQIQNLTKKRVRDLLSKFSTTGMSRSGISGVAQNDIYSNAGEQLSGVAAQGAQMDENTRMKALQGMEGIAQYEDQKPTFLDFLGSMAGQVGGMAGGMGLSKLFGMGGGGQQRGDPLSFGYQAPKNYAQDFTTVEP